MENMKGVVVENMKCVVLPSSRVWSISCSLCSIRESLKKRRMHVGSLFLRTLFIFSSCSSKEIFLVEHIHWGEGEGGRRKEGGGEGEGRRKRKMKEYVYV